MLNNTWLPIVNLKTVSARNGSIPDEVLWNNFKAGNELALSMLYKKYVHRLYSFGMHTCRNHDMVMDCLQDLFYTLCNRRENLSNIYFVKSYLFKSFRRLLIHQSIEKRKHLAPLEEHETFEFMPSVESVLIDDEIRAEQTSRIKNCVQSLTKNQREIIYLKFFQELTYQQIAEVTELHIDSVYNLVSKTIELLRTTGSKATRSGSLNRTLAIVDPAFLRATIHLDQHTLAILYCELVDRS